MKQSNCLNQSTSSCLYSFLWIFFICPHSSYHSTSAQFFYLSFHSLSVIFQCSSLFLFIYFTLFLPQVFIHLPVLFASLPPSLWWQCTLERGMREEEEMSSRVRAFTSTVHRLLSFLRHFPSSYSCSPYLAFPPLIHLETLLKCSGHMEMNDGLTARAYKMEKISTFKSGIFWSGSVTTMLRRPWAHLQCKMTFNKTRHQTLSQ